MKWKFWKRKKISATDVEYIDNINIIAQENTTKLEKFHELFCPEVYNATLGFKVTHNELLSEAIKLKIRLIRSNQAKATLT